MAEIEDYGGLDDGELARRLHVASSNAAHFAGLRDRMAHALQARLEARDATVLQHPTLDVVLAEGSPTWDYTRLRQLKELVAPEELAAGFTPEHEAVVLVPEKWNMTRVWPLRKLGGDVKGIIEASRIPGRRRLKVTGKRPARAVASSL